jgi:hypothetical protein
MARAHRPQADRPQADRPKAGYLLGLGAVQSILGFTPR